MRTVVALYDDIVNARAAVEDVVDAGVPRDDVSLIARDVENKYSRELEQDYDEGDKVGEGAAVGATGGAVMGGLAGVLVGLGALAIPGIGPVVAAGPIAAGLTGAGIGAVTGGLIGALAGWGIPEEEAEYYAEGLRRGGTLVAVRIDDERAEDVVDIMEDHDPVDVERRAAYWRSEDDWTGYDPQAEPYDAQQLSSYRERRTSWESEYDYDDMSGGRVRTHSGVASGYGATGTERGTFDDYDDDFRRHYDSTFATTSYGYDRYQPAYRYGYTLANDRRYQDTAWNSVEPTVQRRWEETNEGTWDEFKDAVRHGWERAKRAVS